jgi:hypothetical protein
LTEKSQEIFKPQFFFIVTDLFSKFINFVSNLNIFSWLTKKKDLGNEILNCKYFGRNNPRITLNKCLNEADIQPFVDYFAFFSLQRNKKPPKKRAFNYLIIPDDGSDVVELSQRQFRLRTDLPRRKVSFNW